MQSDKTCIKPESHCNLSEVQAQEKLNLFNNHHQQGQQQ